MRFLKKHVDDIMSDKHLRGNGIFYLIKTQKLPNENSYPIDTAFQSQLLCQFNSSENNFCRIALYYQVSINVVGHQTLCGISKVVFQKEGFTQQPISLIILYRLPNSLVATFLDVI